MELETLNFQNMKWPQGDSFVTKIYNGEILEPEHTKVDINEARIPITIGSKDINLAMEDGSSKVDSTSNIKVANWVNFETFEV